MNCIDFRRDALVQPLRLGDAARAHAEACVACREFIERQRQLDADLFDALSVPVPDGLAERIVLARGMRPARRRPWILAVAASLAIAAGLASFLPAYLAGNALAGETIAHVKEEPQSFTQVARHSANLLQSGLAAQGLRLAAHLGEVTYAQLCPMRSGKAQHLVVATPEGPVTLFLMPLDTTSRRRTEKDADGMSVVTLPAGRGSIAIVASTRAKVLAVERLLVLA